MNREVEAVRNATAQELTRTASQFAKALAWHRIVHADTQPGPDRATKLRPITNPDELLKLMRGAIEAVKESIAHAAAVRYAKIVAEIEADPSTAISHDDDSLN